MTDKTKSNLKSALSAEVTRDLAQRGTPWHAPKGRVLLAQGEPGNHLLLLRTGQVEVSTVSLSGRKLVLAHFGPGDLVGEVALLDRSTRSATATAMSDVTGHNVGFEDFRAFLLEHPDVHFALTVELCTKLRGANTVLEDQTQKDGATRLARAILRLADKFGKSDADGTAVSVGLSLSQSDIGDLSGLTRANVNRFLRAWTTDGLVTFDKGRLQIHDTARLQDLAEA